MRFLVSRDYPSFNIAATRARDGPRVVALDPVVTLAAGIGVAVHATAVALDVLLDIGRPLLARGAGADAVARHRVGSGDIRARDLLTGVRTGQAERATARTVLGHRAARPGIRRHGDQGDEDQQGEEDRSAQHGKLLSFQDSCVFLDLSLLQGSVPAGQISEPRAAPVTHRSRRRPCPGSARTARRARCGRCSSSLSACR